MTVISCVRDTAQSSLNIFRTANRSLKAQTALDFVMQVQPNWAAYLFYTTIRCAGLGLKGRNENERCATWRQAQLYSSTKVAGLLVSQAALYALGLTTLPAVGAILCWGGVLAGASCFARHKAREAWFS